MNKLWAYEFRNEGNQPKAAFSETVGVIIANGIMYFPPKILLTPENGWAGGQRFMVDEAGKKAVMFLQGISDLRAKAYFIELTASAAKEAPANGNGNPHITITYTSKLAAGTGGSSIMF